MSYKELLCDGKCEDCTIAKLLREFCVEIRYADEVYDWCDCLLHPKVCDAGDWNNLYDKYDLLVSEYKQKIRRIEEKLERHISKRRHD